MKLYEINNQIERVLLDGTDHETGEITEAALDALAALELSRDEKALAVACYIKGEDAEAEAIESEAARLTARARAHRGRADRLLVYLEREIPSGTKLRDARATIGWRTVSSVEVYDEAMLPESCVRIKREANKLEVRDRLKAGEVVPGAVLRTSARLQVR